MQTITREFNAIWLGGKWCVEVQQSTGNWKFLGERKTVKGVMSLVKLNAIRPDDDEGITEIQNVTFIS